MTVLDYVLDGLEAALELERELGVRSIEVDRGLLTVPVGKAVPPPPRQKDVKPTLPPPPPPPPPPVASAPLPSPSPSAATLPLVFLHDRPLSEKGVEMLAKIIVAMGRTRENTPLVIAPPVPKAKIVVVLGGRAMKKFYPDLRGEPGQWHGSGGATEILITYSPEYILRFGTVTPAVETLKRDMWKSLKAVVQRLGVHR